MGIEAYNGDIGGALPTAESDEGGALDQGLGRSAAVDRALATLVRDGGPRSWTDSAAVRESLRAALPEEGLRVDLLMAVVDTGVIADLASMPERDTMREAQLIQRLIIERYYADSDARFAVEAWARALHEPSASVAGRAEVAATLAAVAAARPQQQPAGGFDAPAARASQVATTGAGWQAAPSAPQGLPTPEVAPGRPGGPAPVPPVPAAQQPTSAAPYPPFAGPGNAPRPRIPASAPALPNIRPSRPRTASSNKARGFIIGAIVLFVVISNVSRCASGALTSLSGDSGNTPAVVDTSPATDAATYASDQLNYPEAVASTASETLAGLADAPVAVREYLRSYAKDPANAEAAWVAVANSEHGSGYVIVKPDWQRSWALQLAIVRPAGGKYALTGPLAAGVPGQ